MASKGLRIDFAGQKELLENMENLSEEIRNSAKTEAIMAAAEIVKEDASRRAPVDTGDLKDSIIVEIVKNNELVTEAKVGPNRKAFYSMFVEYGTRNIQAKPYLRPAFDENEDKINEAITQKLQEAIKKAVKDVDTGEN